MKIFSVRKLPICCEWSNHTCKKGTRFQPNHRWHKMVECLFPKLLCWTCSEFWSSYSTILYWNLTVTVHEFSFSFKSKLWCKYIFIFLFSLPLSFYLLLSLPISFFLPLYLSISIFSLSLSIASPLFFLLIHVKTIILHSINATHDVKKLMKISLFYCLSVCRPNNWLHRESHPQPQNIMYDKRVVRGSNYSHIHMQAVSEYISKKAWIISAPASPT